MCIRDSNTGGNVGIATSNPQSTLQIGTNPDIVGNKGVGLSSIGNINASGIISATTFIGNLTGNVTGNISGNITGAAVSAAQLQTARLIGGVSFDGTSNIDLAGVNIAGNQNTSGTAANLSGTPNILINNLNTSGVSTFSEDIITGIGATVGIGTTVFFGDDVKSVFGNNENLEIYHTGSSGIVKNTTGQLQIQTPQFGITNAAASNYGLYMVENAQIQLYYAGDKKLETTQNGVTVSPQLDTTCLLYTSPTPRDA